MRFLRGFTLGAVISAALLFAACSDDPSPPLDPLSKSDVQPAPAAMRRLLARQYTNSVEQMLGPTAAAAARPPVDTALHGYQAIAASQLALTDELVARYEISARAIAKAAVSSPEQLDALVGCSPAKLGETACFQAFVERIGRLAFRRPLDESEVAEYVDVATTALDNIGTFEAGIEFAIVALLESPSFLFQVEVGEPKGPNDGARRLTGYEVASRMSLFLLDRGPDDELLDAAADGVLDTEEGVREHAARLVRRYDAREASIAFFSEYFVLTELADMPKDPNLFPAYSREVAQSMRQETEALIEDVIWTRNAPVTELLTADYSFLDERLAALYEVKLAGDPWAPMSLPDEQQRSGILSHASILAAQSHADSTSVTHRGMFVLERLMCTSMPPPPEGVVTVLPPTSTAPTMRERVAVHLEEDMCAGCHSMVDGMGLALENFDAIGRWRDQENGETIDASGDSSMLGSFVGVRELSEMLASSELATDCMVRNLYRHATGHVETKDELPALQSLHASFATHGFRWRELLIDITASPLFRSVGPREIDDGTPTEGTP